LQNSFRTLNEQVRLATLGAAMATKACLVEARRLPTKQSFARSLLSFEFGIIQN